MKLVKLSLVAAMAAGFMASTASATPLDELIKNVDASGYTRMRYNHASTKDSEGVKTSKSTWQFKGELNLKTTIDDNFFAVVGGQFTNASAGETHSTIDPNEEHSERLINAYFGYNIAGTTVTVGRQVLGTFFTDDMFGNGIKVVNTDVEGLTLAALFMDSLENDGDIGTIGNLRELDEKFSPLAAVANMKEIYIKNVLGKNTTDHNLYGVAAIGSYDPVSFQLWYATLEDVTNLFAAELGFDFDVTDDVNLGLKAQYAFADLKSKFKNGINNAMEPVNLNAQPLTTVKVDDSDFWAIEASSKLFGLDFAAGYVNYSTKRDKYSLSSFEDAGAFIKYGEQLAEDYNLYKGKNNYFFVSAGYEIPDTDFSFGVEYLNGKTKVTDVDLDGSNPTNYKTKKQEIVGRVAYQATEQLEFSSWYSHYEAKTDGEKDKSNKFRFQAKYSF